MYGSVDLIAGQSKGGELAEGAPSAVAVATVATHTHRIAVAGLEASEQEVSGGRSKCAEGLGGIVGDDLNLILVGQAGKARLQRPVEHGTRSADVDSLDISYLRTSGGFLESEVIGVGIPTAA